MVSNQKDGTDRRAAPLGDDDARMGSTDPSRAAMPRRRARRHPTPTAAANVLWIGCLGAALVRQGTAWTAWAFGGDGGSSLLRPRHLPSRAAASARARRRLPPASAAGPWPFACRSTVSDETAEADTLSARLINVNGANGLPTLNGNGVHVNGVSTVPSTFIRDKDEEDEDEDEDEDEANGRQPPPESDAAASPTEAAPRGNGDDGGPLPAAVADAPAAPSDSDVPRPTANGGYSHTTSSRAKISAANKGKTPWNKGQARSDEVKARIAAGVRRRNRENFLAKLAAEGITEEEYNRRQKEEKRAKEAERRRRRTAKGGYTPTAETREKISRILKEKYASGEVTRAPRSPAKIRRGFHHSEETKRKISASLRKKWAEDPEYRDLMSNKTFGGSDGQGPSVRQRISDTLKQRWKEPEFRAAMLEKFAKARGGARGTTTRGAAHRKKISEAMKRKWRDDAYRQRVSAGMSKGQEGVNGASGRQKPVRRRPQKGATAAQKKPKRAFQAVTPLAPVQAKPKTASVTPLSPAKAKPRTEQKKQAKRKKRKTTKRSSKSVAGAGAGAKAPSASAQANGAAPWESTSKNTDGDISLLREERRDLYDLLYGDGEEDEHEPGRAPGWDHPASRQGAHDDDLEAAFGGLAALLADDDVDLDEYDPYGLH